MIDTLKASEELLAAKFTPEQAKAIIHVHSTSTNDLVTRDWLDARLAILEATIDGKLGRLHVHIVVWMVGLLVLSVVIQKYL